MFNPLLEFSVDPKDRVVVIIVTTAKEVMFSVGLVCLLAHYSKSYERIAVQFYGENVVKGTSE